MKDLHNNLLFKRGLSPVAAGTDNTAYVSQIADRANGEALEWVTLIGANTDADATFTVLMEESDASDMTGATAVADADLLGTEAGASFDYSHDNQVSKLGYTGSKRYVRVTITPANNGAGNIFIAGVWVHGGQRVGPASTQRG